MKEKQRRKRGPMVGEEEAETKRAAGWRGRRSGRRSGRRTGREEGGRRGETQGKEERESRVETGVAGGEAKTEGSKEREFTERIGLIRCFDRMVFCVGYMRVLKFNFCIRLHCFIVINLDERSEFYYVLNSQISKMSLYYMHDIAHNLVRIFMC